MIGFETNISSGEFQNEVNSPSCHLVELSNLEIFQMLLPSASTNCNFLVIIFTIRSMTDWSTHLNDTNPDF